MACLYHCLFQLCTGTVSGNILVFKRLQSCIYSTLMLLPIRMAWTPFLWKDEFKKKNVFLSEIQWHDLHSSLCTYMWIGQCIHTRTLSGTEAESNKLCDGRGVIISLWSTKMATTQQEQTEASEQCAHFHVGIWKSGAIRRNGKQ